MSRQVQWRRVVAEGAMIVVSILLAFSLQAWWEGRQERSAELDVLTRLDEELRESAEHLAAWRQNHIGVAKAGREILVHTDPRIPPSLSTDSVANLLWAFNFNWDADPPRGVLTSVISTGRLAIVRNQDLQAELIQWDADFRDLQRAEEVTAEMAYERLIPYLERELAFRDIVAEVVAPDVSAGLFEFGSSEVFADREFESIVANRIAFIDVVVAKYDNVLTGLDQVRSLVADELAGGR